MGKLTPVSWNELVRRLRRLGFEGPVGGGKHPHMVRGRKVLTIPNPHQREIGVNLLARILRRAEISREDWEQSK